MSWITFVFVMLFVVSMGVAFYKRTYGSVVAMGLFVVGGGIALRKFGFPPEGALMVNIASALVLVLCVKRKLVLNKARKPKTLQVDGGVVAHSAHGLR